jgi:uncharacterized protein YggU (UPF0235/DUF167 family)
MENAKDLALKHLTETGTLALKVTPRARTEAIDRLETSADGLPLLKIKVRAVAEDGRANEAVINLLADSWKIPKSSLEIVRGFTSRNKVIAYRGSRS